MDAIWFFIIGSVAGLLAWVIRKGRGSDFVGYLVGGVTGAVIGGMFVVQGGLPLQGQFGPFIVSAAGAVIVLVVIELSRKV